MVFALPMLKGSLNWPLETSVYQAIRLACVLLKYALKYKHILQKHAFMIDFKMYVISKEGSMHRFFNGNEVQYAI